MSEGTTGETASTRLSLALNALQLDLLASRASGALTAAGIGHALIKGPTTSYWLYDPPRPFTDVDLLVPATRVSEAVEVLDRNGIAHPTAGRFGEQAAHSQQLLTPLGFEIDLHGTLPTMVIDRGNPDHVWRVLARWVEGFDLGEGLGRVPALAESARAVVLTLHALGCGPDDVRVAEDLRRAWERLDRDGWTLAREIAVELGVADRFDAMAAILTGGPMPSVEGETALWLSGAPGIQIQWARLRALPMRQQPCAVIREAFPSAGFMHHKYPGAVGGRGRLLLGYLRRISGLAVVAFRAWRESGFDSRGERV